MQDLIIIGAYLDTYEKETDCLNNIKILKNAGFDILVSSHYPLSFDIQQAADYCIYDKNNVLFDQKDVGIVGSYYYHDSSQVRFVNYIEKRNASVATLSLLRNAMVLAQNLGYKKALFLEFDVLIDPKDIPNLIKFKEKDNNLSTEGVFITDNDQSICGLLFYAPIEQYLKYIPNIQSSDQFKQYPNHIYTSESLIYSRLIENIPYSFYNLNIKNILPNSIINKYISGRPYNYIYNFVKVDKSPDLVALCIDVNDKSGEDIDVEVVTTREDRLKFTTKRGFQYYRFDKELKYRIYFSVNGKVIEHKIFDLKEIENSNSHLVIK